MNDSASQQLAALAHVVACLDDAAVQYCLFGGWAVDFHAGRITREHDDIDLAVWLDDHPRVAALLEAEGWRHAPEPDEDGGTGYERGSIRLELTFLVRAADGSIRIPLRDARPVWPMNALTEATAELCGVRAKVMPLEPLARGKSQLRDEPDEVAKDRVDAAVLAELIERR